MSDGDLPDTTDTARVVAMGTRQYTTEIAAPLSPRVKVRLQRAITQTLLNPTRGAPTLRRTVVMVAKELRRCGFSEERIRTLFARVIEDVACVRSLHRTSLMSGQPRWAEVFARVDSWLGATHEQTEPHS